MNVGGFYAPHWVYRMFDAEGRLLYVGMTWRPSRRMTEWRRDSRAGVERASWFEQVARVTWQRYANRPLALGAERRAIQSEHPVHNVMLSRHAEAVAS